MNVTEAIHLIFQRKQDNTSEIADINREKHTRHMDKSELRDLENRKSELVAENLALESDLAALRQLEQAHNDARHAALRYQDNLRHWAIAFIASGDARHKRTTSGDPMEGRSTIDIALSLATAAEDQLAGIASIPEPPPVDDEDLIETLERIDAENNAD